NKVYPLQVQLGDQCVQVAGQGIVVVPFPRGVRLAEPSSVVCDDPESCSDKCADLVFPSFMAQGPAVDEDNGVACPVIYVVDTYFWSCCFIKDAWHISLFLFSCFYVLSCV